MSENAVQVPAYPGVVVSTTARHVTLAPSHMARTTGGPRADAVAYPHARESRTDGEIPTDLDFNPG